MYILLIQYTTASLKIKNLNFMKKLFFSNLIKKNNETKNWKYTLIINSSSLLQTRQNLIDYKLNKNIEKI